MKNLKTISLCLYIATGNILFACGNKGPLFLPKEDVLSGPEQADVPAQLENPHLGSDVTLKAIGLCPFNEMTKGIYTLDN